MIILLAVGFPLIGSISGQEGFSSEVDRVKTFIERAKNLAQNPENKDAVGYQIETNSSKNVIILKRITVSNPLTGLETTSEIEQNGTLQLAKGVKVSTLKTVCVGGSEPPVIKFYTSSGEQKCSKSDVSVRTSTVVLAKGSKMSETLRIINGYISVVTPTPTSSSTP